MKDRELYVDMEFYVSSWVVPIGFGQPKNLLSIDAPKQKKNIKRCTFIIKTTKPYVLPLFLAFY